MNNIKQLLKTKAARVVMTASLTVSILGSVTSIGWNLRAFSPYPSNYIARMRMLNGWSSQNYYAFNCSGFIANAHGDDFIDERQMFRGEGGMTILRELPNRYAINEADLQPGDVIAFAGPQGIGLHVAAYLGDGKWMDGNSRRGYVTSYRLADVPANDEWFTGCVRILRWNHPARTRFRFDFFTQEQQHIANE